MKAVKWILIIISPICIFMMAFFKLPFYLKTITFIIPLIWLVWTSYDLWFKKGNTYKFYLKSKTDPGSELLRFNDPSHFSYVTKNSMHCQEEVSLSSLEQIHINIWDDYYDDGYVPIPEIQETYIYVEEFLSQSIQKECLNELLNYISNNIQLEAQLNLFYKNTKKNYPHLVGTEHEWCLYERWEIKVVNLSHKRREILIEELNSASLKYKDIPLIIISES